MTRACLVGGMNVAASQSGLRHFQDTCNLTSSICHIHDTQAPYRAHPSHDLYQTLSPITIQEPSSDYAFHSSNMSSDNSHIRTQTLANARLLLRPSTGTAIPSLHTNNTSQSTLVAASNSTYAGDIDVVVFGDPSRYKAAVMVGLTPAIESEASVTPEGALRKLLESTCELLAKYIPKVVSHSFSSETFWEV